MSDDMLGENYRVIEELGTGGEGVVLKAECVHSTGNVQAGEIVAIKMLHSVGDTAETSRDFELRAQALCSLAHENIVRYRAYFSHRAFASELKCLVLDYLSGKTLQEWLRSIQKDCHGSMYR